MNATTKEGLDAAINAIIALERLDRTLTDNGDGYFVTGTIELHHSDGFKVGEIVYEDDFWRFQAEES